MKTAGIIAEYNPFHNGHAYHIEMTKQETSCDAVVVVLSGNFVQRGEGAVLDKFTRAKIAVSCGADLVIELPTPFCLSSAETFAFGGVSLLSALGIVDILSFGSESGELAQLKLLSNELLEDSLYDEIKKLLKGGLSFPVAREKALMNLGLDTSLLKSSNNILAFEYLKALSRLKSNIEPFTIPRYGAAYHEKLPDKGVLSATGVRALLFSPKFEQIKDYVPPMCYDILVEAKSKDALVAEELFDIPLLSVLKRMPPEEFLMYADVSEGLHNRLSSCISEASSIEELLALLKTKRYTLTRLRRIIYNIFLGLCKSYTQSPPSYIRPLAFNETGRELLSKIRESATLPIITKAAHSKKLPENVKKLFDAEARCGNLYHLARPIHMRSQNEDYLLNPIYLK